MAAPFPKGSGLGASPPEAFKPLAPRSSPLCHHPAPWPPLSRGAGVWHGEGPPEPPGHGAASPESCRGGCNAASFGQKTSWGFAPQPSTVTWHPAPNSAKKKEKAQAPACAHGSRGFAPCQEPWDPQHPPPLPPLVAFFLDSLGLFFFFCIFFYIFSRSFLSTSLPKKKKNQTKEENPAMGALEPGARLLGGR